MTLVAPTAKGNGSAFRRVLPSLVYIFLWYAFSIGITYFNKWLFHTHHFPFPLSTTVVHTFIITAFARSWRYTRWQLSGVIPPTASLYDVSRQVFPAGAATALDVGLSNMALTVIHITLYTICKSTMIIWLLVFSFLFKIERPTVPLLVVISMISGGLILFQSRDSVSFHSLGFILVMGAAVMGGLRWVLCQIVLHKADLGLTNPIDTVYYVAPCTGLAMLPFALYLEGAQLVRSPLLFQAPVAVACQTLLAVLFGGCLAFGLTANEYYLVRETSGVTLLVAGIFKEIITLLTAVVFGHETLSNVNMLGLFVSLAGIVYYNVLKFKAQQVEADNTAPR